MISFIYQIATHFEQNHGTRPNLLYISPDHYTHLREELAAIESREAVVRLLGMEIIISTEAIHPQVVAVNLHPMIAVGMH